MTRKFKSTLDLNGLTVAPSQQCGSFRLVPLLREKPCSDIRLGIENYDNLARVELGDRTEYWAFVPHGFILDWSGDNDSQIAVGGRMQKKDVKVSSKKDTHSYNTANMHRMVKKRGRTALRMLPLHLSIEYFLALAFGGPNICWPEYSKFARRFGLGFRFEIGLSGHSLYRFEEALRVFEIYDNQVGVMVFTGEELASIFVVPSQADYRKVHYTLLSDFFGELIWSNAMHLNHQELSPSFEIKNKASVSDLRDALAKAREQWSQFSLMMASSLVQREISGEKVYSPGDYRLERFMTDIDLNQANIIGERLLRNDGEVLYMKTFRLSDEQSRKAWLLNNLAKHDWHIDTTAGALDLSKDELIRRLDRAGFGYLVNPELLGRVLKK